MASNESTRANRQNKKRKHSIEPSIENGESACPWTQANDVKLFDRVEEFLSTYKPTSRRVKFTYPKHIVWEDVKFDDFTAESCKTRWFLLSSRVRKMRSAKEVLGDTRQLYLEDIAKAKRKMARKQAKSVASASGQPKRPLTAFFRYVQAKRESMAEKHPDLKGTELVQRLSSKWKKLPEKTRQKYQRRYERERAEFDENLRSYLIEHHPEMDPPRSAFELWSVKERERIIELKGEMSPKKMKKKIERHWENLDDEVRMEWEERSKRDYKSFKSRILKKEKKEKQKVEP